MKKLLFILIFFIGCNPNTSKEIQDIKCTTYDNKVFGTISGKEEYNKNLLQIRGLQNKIQVVAGAMSEHEAKIDSVNYATMVKIKDSGLRKMALAMERGCPYKKAKEHLDSIVTEASIKFPIK